MISVGMFNVVLPVVAGNSISLVSDTDEAIDRLIEEINKNHGTVENLVLVGHEPYVGNLISMLISGDPTNSITLKKGGVCRLSLESLQYGRCAALDWMLLPAQLVEIGG